MNQNKISGMLSISKKAGFLLSGTDIVLESVRKKKVQLVLLAENASDNTRKKVQNCCTYYGAPFEFAPLDTEALGKCIGKKGLISTVGITDVGMANAILKLLSTRKDQTEWEDKV